MSYTPRQLKGWLSLGERRRKGEMYLMIEAFRLANPQTKDAAKESNQKRRKLSEESQ